MESTILFLVTNVKIQFWSYHYDSKLSHDSEHLDEKVL